MQKYTHEISMVQTTPFLLFDGNCAEAMTFYQKCLGGELTLTKVSDTPMKAQYSEEKHNRIIYSQLINDAINISATDWLHPTRRPQQGNTVCIYITGRSEELKSIFDSLSEGAPKEFLDELRDMPFGSYGHLADKYGVHWFFKGEKKE
jgi:PhnB protein